MSEVDPRQFFANCLRDLSRWFRCEKVLGAVVGGVAASLLGRPRTTLDVDALVILPQERWEGFLQQGTQHGFAPRADLAEVLQFAQEHRVLLLMHRATGIEVDVIFGELPFEHEAVERRRHVRLGRLSVPVVTPEDLVIMKATAKRQRDNADIAGILDVQQKLDLKRVREWVKRFAALVDDPEIIENLESLLKGRFRKKPHKKT